MAILAYSTIEENIMKTFDKTKFTNLKKSITRSGNTLKVAVQDLVEMGLSHYLETGDTCHLTSAMQCCVNQPSLRTNTLKAYLKEAANVKWIRVKNKNGQTETVFKKVEKGVDATVNVELVDNTKWYEFSNEGQATPDMDIEAQFKSFLTRAAKALDAGTFKGDKEKVEQLVHNAQSLLA